jgi:hypothetical protein
MLADRTEMNEYNKTSAGGIYDAHLASWTAPSITATVNLRNTLDAICFHQPIWVLFRCHFQNLYTSFISYNKMSITDYKQTLKSVFAVILRVLTQIL